MRRARSAIVFSVWCFRQSAQPFESSRASSGASLRSTRWSATRLLVSLQPGHWQTPPDAIAEGYHANAGGCEPRWQACGIGHGGAADVRSSTEGSTHDRREACPPYSQDQLDAGQPADRRWQLVFALAAEDQAERMHDRAVHSIASSGAAVPARAALASLTVSAPAACDRTQRLHVGLCRSSSAPILPAYAAVVVSRFRRSCAHRSPAFVRLAAVRRYPGASLARAPNPLSRVTRGSRRQCAANIAVQIG
jgi:hypothetical protein